MSFRAGGRRYTQARVLPPVTPSQQRSLIYQRGKDEGKGEEVSEPVCEKAVQACGSISGGINGIRGSPLSKNEFYDLGGRQIEQRKRYRLEAEPGAYAACGRGGTSLTLASKDKCTQKYIKEILAGGVGQSCEEEVVSHAVSAGAQLWKL
ncbi:unnamed protein product [Arctogadus glacialis]